MKSPLALTTFTRLSSPLRQTSVAVMVLLAWTLVAGLLRTQDASAQTQSRYYAQTGYSISGPFLSFFDRYGGVRIFGYPLSGVVQEEGRPVQYFERQRFEYHSELAGTQYEVQLSLLGTRFAPSAALATGAGSTNGQPGFLLVPETHHTLGAPFLAYWNANGGVRIFGYPISEAVMENGLRVQYFERARMEYHPEKATAGFGVELGLLGRQLLYSEALQLDNTRTAQPASRGGTGSSQATTASLTTKENRLFALINNARQQSGASPVALDSTLRGIAVSRSRDMVARNYFSHTTPDGTDFLAMLKNAGVPYKYAGEIIGNNNYADAQAADTAFTNFMNSQHHHDIMLDPRYVIAGVGESTNSKGFHYFTVIFVQK